MSDITAIVETATRRAAALRTGMGSRNPKTYDGPRADADSPLDRPELLWPSERHLLPDRCWNCGAGQGAFNPDVPHGLQKRGQTTCLICSRTIVRWKADGTRGTAVRP